MLSCILYHWNFFQLVLERTLALIPIKCKCWLCNKEGHYANECHGKKVSRQTKALIEQIENEYDPVTYSDIETEESFCEIEISSDESSGENSEE